MIFPTQGGIAFAKPFFPHLVQLAGFDGLAQTCWINGIYFFGYTVAVPLLTSLTDRMDARRIYLAGCAIGILPNLGFTFLAGGFWSALCFRAMCGISLADTFVPGLMALMDLLPLSVQPRGIAF